MVPSSTAWTRSPSRRGAASAVSAASTCRVSEPPQHPRVRARDLAHVAPERAGVGDRQRGGGAHRPDPHRVRLAGDHGAEVGPRAEQVAVRPDRGHPALAEEDDLVDGVQHQGAGADHDRGASGPVVAQPGGDPGLGVGVDGRGRLDEHEDLRVGGEDAGQDQPLPLAAGERAAALGDDRVHAVGERLEDVLGRGGGEGVVDRAGARHVEAVAEPAGEQRGAGVGDDDAAAYVRSWERTSAGRRPSVTSPSTTSAHMPSRSASAAASSGRSLTMAVTEPGRTTRPVRASASTEPAGGASLGLLRVDVVGRQREHATHAGGGDPAPDDLVGVLGGGAQRDHQERRVAVERDQLARR